MTTIAFDIQPATLEQALARPYPFAATPSPNGGYDIVFPDLPGCSSWAESLEDIPQQVRDAIESWVEAEFEANHPLPTPSNDWDPSPPWPTTPIRRLDGQPAPPPVPIYTTERVAGILDITPARVRQIAQERDLGQKVASVWMFTPTDVVAMQDRPGRGRPAHTGKSTEALAANGTRD